MIDKIKSNLTNSYLMFIFDFADPSNVNKEEISEFIGCPIIEIFQSQKMADKSKKLLGKNGFGKALVCYFNLFQSQDGVNFRKLDAEMTKHKKVFLRHLGKDKVSFLNLMIKISESIEPKKRGLLAS